VKKKIPDWLPKVFFFAICGCVLAMLGGGFTFLELLKTTGLTFIILGYQALVEEQLKHNKDEKFDLILANQQEINHRLDELQQALSTSQTTTNNLALTDDTNTKSLPVQEETLPVAEKNGVVP
jgi:hypothetical protein